jgi:hypothetical protein
VDSDPAECLKILERVLPFIPGSNPRLVWFAETIKIDCLLGIGAPEEALLHSMPLSGCTPTKPVV